MTQAEKRLYLIKALLSERRCYDDTLIPGKAEEQKRLLRSLMNIRAPEKTNEDFIRIQDEYLRAETAAKGITDFKTLVPISDGIYLWQGDITTLKCDAIVNAANSKMTGCYYPCHGCIDNAIHTFAGIGLRLECAELIKRQGHDEPVGSAKITGAYDLPCRYVIHTVGPFIGDAVTEEDEEALASCYRSCLMTAEEYGLKSIAFCCISTGEFHFPNKRAAEIAVETVMSYKKRTDSKIEVIFNVFKNMDYEIYQELLGEG